MADSRSSIVQIHNFDDFASGHQPLSRIIYQRLRNDILSGALQPGHLLRQEELAATFQASRVPLREALNHLEAEGLVKLRPRRGYIVSSLRPEEIIELVQLRVVLEEHAGYVATLNRSSKDIVAVMDALERLEKLQIENPDDSEIKNWVRENRNFHGVLVGASGRTQLCQIVENLHAKIGRYIQIELAIGSDFAESQAEHRLIAEGFAAGDALLVAEISRRHCERTAVRFARALNQKGLAEEHLEETILEYGPERVSAANAAYRVMLPRGKAARSSHKNTRRK